MSISCNLEKRLKSSLLLNKRTNTLTDPVGYLLGYSQKGSVLFLVSGHQWKKLYLNFSDRCQPTCLYASLLRCEPTSFYPRLLTRLPPCKLPGLFPSLAPGLNPSLITSLIPCLLPSRIRILLRNLIRSLIPGLVRSPPTSPPPRRYPSPKGNQI